MGKKRRRTPRVSTAHGAAQSVVTPTAGAAQCVVTPTPGTAQCVTPRAGAAQSVVTPTAGAAQSVVTPTAGAAQSVVTPTAGAAQSVVTPTAGAAQSVVTPIIPGQDHYYSTPILNPGECSVCFTTYNECEQRPRTMPCGHTFCSPCIDSMLEGGQVSCPTCRAHHPATSATQFPISYSIEAFMKQLEATSTAKSPVLCLPLSASAKVSCQKLSTRISRKLRSLLEEQKNNVSSMVAGSQEVQSQLDQYRSHLADRKTQHLHLLDRLYDLVQQNKSALELLEQEDNNVLGMKAEGEKQLEAVLGSLQTVNTAQEVVTAIDHADHCTVEAEDWMQKCQELFPDVNAIKTTMKVEDLRRMRPPIKRLVEAGLVFGVQEDQGGLRSSKITLENGQLYLHCLRGQPPPPHARTLPMNEMVGALDSSSTLVFLELSWPGSTRGRVHIRLNPDVSRSRQFVLLCTGQQGHSYLDTILLQVWGKGQPGEFVEGGDYEHKSGEGGVQLLPLSDHEHWELGKAGTVWAWYSPSSERSAQFIITTRDRENGRRRNYVIGEVESGLEVVRAAANHSNIRQVTVVDCGVVVSL